jgi:hypothetical protein
MSDRAILLFAAGATYEEAIFLLAVSEPESGGAAYVYGDDDIVKEGDRSIGPWQMYESPARGWVGGIRDSEANLDPYTSARHAVKLLREQGEDAWSAAKAGNHIASIDDAQQEIDSLGLYDN